MIFGGGVRLGSATLFQTKILTFLVFFFRPGLKNSYSFFLESTLVPT